MLFQTCRLTLLLAWWVITAAEASSQTAPKKHKQPARNSSAQKPTVLPYNDSEFGERIVCTGGHWDSDEIEIDRRPDTVLGTQPCSIVDEQPKFPGDMRAWFGVNVVYPDSAREAGVEGRVIVRFIVEVDGSLTELRIMRSVSPELDAEAIRLVNAMPCWQPARSMGNVVRAYFSLPIKFYLED